jgi:hypothetical protein
MTFVVLSSDIMSQTPTDLISYSLSTNGHFQLVEKGKYCSIPQPFDVAILSLLTNGFPRVHSVEWREKGEMYLWGVINLTQQGNVMTRFQFYTFQACMVRL